MGALNTLTEGQSDKLYIVKKEKKETTNLKNNIIHIYYQAFRLYESRRGTLGGKQQ